MAFATHNQRLSRHRRLLAEESVGKCRFKRFIPQSGEPLAISVGRIWVQLEAGKTDGTMHVYLQHCLARYRRSEWKLCYHVQEMRDEWFDGYSEDVGSAGNAGSSCSGGAR